MATIVEAQSLQQPGAKVQTIIELANSIATKVMTILASYPESISENYLSGIGMEALLHSIHIAASDIHSLSTAVVSSGCVGEFINFPRLLIEIRNKIWGHAVEGLRIVELYVAASSTSSSCWELSIGNCVDISTIGQS